MTENQFVIGPNVIPDFSDRPHFRLVAAILNLELDNIVSHFHALDRSGIRLSINYEGLGVAGQIDGDGPRP